jgi:hypothetical protein
MRSLKDRDKTNRQPAPERAPRAILDRLAASELMTDEYDELVEALGGNGHSAGGMQNPEPARASARGGEGRASFSSHGPGHHSFLPSRVVSSADSSSVAPPEMRSRGDESWCLSHPLFAA